MKKTLALILSVLMVVSVAAFGSMSVAAESTTFITPGSDWSYYYYLDDGTAADGAELPTGWNEVGFDASAWEVGATPFAESVYGASFPTVFVTEGKKLTVAAVKTFEVEDVSKIELLTMAFNYDEDPIVYINGVEVFSRNGYRDVLTDYDLTDKIDTLKNGTNTIAVYMENNIGGGGFRFDLGLTGSTIEIVDESGYVIPKSAEKTGFYDFGGINAAENILDGNVDSCSGAGRDLSGVEQSWTVNFYGEATVGEIYLQCKGKEDNGHTTVSSHPGNDTYAAGVIFGFYNVYVGDELVAENVPAISAEDGGYTVKLTTPVKGSSVKVELTGDWYGDNWANLADITIKEAAAPTGDVAVYATIAVAVAAAALVVVFKKRATI
ncbi:MAG: hypothetical protein E7616_02725 [Ruminococcaceae bacterium]|nr:hypothetical protein [Oscillospiraceae bacterium]